MNRLLVFAVAMAFATQGFAQSRSIKSAVHEIDQLGVIYTQKIVTMDSIKAIVLSFNGSNDEFT